MHIADITNTSSGCSLLNALDHAHFHPYFMHRVEIESKAEMQTIFAISRIRSEQKLYLPLSDVGSGLVDVKALLQLNALNFDKRYYVRIVRTRCTADVVRTYSIHNDIELQRPFIMLNHIRTLIRK